MFSQKVENALPTLLLLAKQCRRKGGRPERRPGEADKAIVFPAPTFYRNERTGSQL